MYNVSVKSFFEMILGTGTGEALWATENVIIEADWEVLNLAKF